IGYFTRQAVPRSSNDITSEYPFVAMDTRQAYVQIYLARHHLLEGQTPRSPLRFLDIGCGIGNILLLAELMDFDVFGIEKDSASLSIAVELVGEKSVGREDIWNYSNIQDFDVVYYFRPFCEKTRQLAFEQHIEDSLKPGAVLIANRKMSGDIDNDPRYSRLSTEWPVWFRNRMQ
ncbi:MAG: class I SAM-dependent methyltransferase, partial [Desulfocapsaceae bacterium]|nr:class I SAM-dependent methyltransferase [Desulfocapsaceae bacterium]